MRVMCRLTGVVAQLLCTMQWSYGRTYDRSKFLTNCTYLRVYLLSQISSRNVVEISAYQWRSQTMGLDVTIFFYNPNIHPRKVSRLQLSAQFFE